MEWKGKQLEDLTEFKTSSQAKLLCDCGYPLALSDIQLSCDIGGELKVVFSVCIN